MKEKGKRLLWIGCIFIAGFAIWTLLIQAVDVQPLGVNGTDISFSTINCWFHQLTGVHWLTDIAGSIMLSVGLFCIYKAAVLLCYKGEN